MGTEWLPAVLLLFAGSGAAALIYEIVWLQLLQLVVGSSSVSMGVLLAVFMGGMCLGSVAAPRLVARRHHPLRVYAWLEIAVGMMAIALLYVLPLVDHVYASWGGYGAAGLLLRGVVAALCLVPPTLAMGAVLPVVARWVESSRPGTSAMHIVGFVYAANLAGAVLGSLLAGFYLLRVYDMRVATFVAAGVNVAAAAVAMRIAAANPVSRVHSVTPPNLANAGNTARRPRRAGLIRIELAIAVSGFCALAAEVVWTRLLALLFGATVYTFSIILAVFLVGLGLGSTAGSWLAKRADRPLAALGCCQLLAAVGIVWSAYALMAVLPYWRTVTPPDQIWLTFRIDIGRALFAILPAPLLWGASFPLALAARSRAPHADAARVVGRVYAANTIGAIAGALGASLLLVGSIGSQHTQQLMVVASAIAGFVAMAGGGRRGVPALAALIAIASASLVPSLPGVLVAYGRHAASWSGHEGEVLYIGEGTSSSVAVSRTADGVLNYHNAGKIQASSQPQDMRLQRMLGHLTTLVPSAPRSVLVIGCGAGVTAGAVSVDPRVERVTIAEIEPLVPRAAAAYFGPVNANVLRNPKVHVQIDDARHFLLTTKDRFDAITSDPLDPWVKGAATLYTKEFFELAKSHLNPGGVMTLFVQLYESSPDAVRSELATFFDAFPNGTIWGNTYEGVTADTVLLGSVDPLAIDLDATAWRIGQPAYAPVRLSLGEIGFFSVEELFGSYGGRAPELADWLRGASVNRDRNLRLQYLAGLGFNLHAGDRIYADILKHRTFPWDLFTGANVAALREIMEGPRE